MQIARLRLSALLFSLALITSFGIYAYAQNMNTTNTKMQQTTRPKSAVSDTQITKQIQQKLSANKMLSDLKVNVATKDGVVTLTGDINTGTEASRIVELAQSVEGVRDVNTSGLKVKESKQPLVDVFISAKVKGLFLREKLFRGKDISVMGINVETKNGVVYLSGTAQNQEQINNAVQLAKSISGVESVDNKVQISSE